MITEFNIKVTDVRAPALMVSNDGTQIFKVFMSVRNKWYLVDSYKSFDSSSVEEAHQEALSFFTKYASSQALQSSYDLIAGGIK